MYLARVLSTLGTAVGILDQELLRNLGIGYYEVPEHRLLAMVVRVGPHCECAAVLHRASIQSAMPSRYAYDSMSLGTSKVLLYNIDELANKTCRKGAFMTSVTRESPTEGCITRRDFVSCAITLVGGAAIFSFPERALAAEGLTTATPCPF